MNETANNLQQIKTRLAAVATAAGRDVNSVRLMAVSKFHPAAAVEEALRAGQRLFGENRVQEANGKFPALRAAYPDLELHLIGPLQTNKAETAVALFDVIQTLDRPALALALAKAMKKLGREVPCFIEINVGNEPQKAGIAPEALADFLKLCREEKGLSVTGLMCIPPQGDDPRPHFRRLRELAVTHSLPQLSMGMSGDFEAATAEGATLVRVGTALFGERKTNE